MYLDTLHQIWCVSRHIVYETDPMQINCDTQSVILVSMAQWGRVFHYLRVDGQDAERFNLPSAHLVSPTHIVIHKQRDPA